MAAVIFGILTLFVTQRPHVSPLAFLKGQQPLWTHTALVVPGVDVDINRAARKVTAVWSTGPDPTGPERTYPSILPGSAPCTEVTEGYAFPGSGKELEHELGKIFGSMYSSTDSRAGETFGVLYGDLVEIKWRQLEGQETTQLTVKSYRDTTGWDKLEAFLRLAYRW